MKGDFSTWRDERRQNFNGVLHQQGRVLLDSDWNAQTAITNGWQDTAALDIIGAGVAAVPADEAESFRVKAAEVTGGQVKLTVAPGRVWADGLLAELFAAADVTRFATYLGPPLPPPPANPGAQGTRDAVVLEVWREEINGFQMPDLLIEPALGGPDTTERVHTEMAFRLFRLTDPADTCESIVDDLQDNFGTKGRLTVTLDAPPPPGDPDCPLVEGGGYTGFEHNLYRIEIADVKTGLAPHFKWSQFGGGLVGRGLFNNLKRIITMNAGQQAILNSGLQKFYLEVLAFDSDLGHWKVAYGANASLGSNGTLTLPNPLANTNADVFFGVPPGDGNVFFRLWNAVAPIVDFDGPAPRPLQDGILLQFDLVAAGNYRAGDYWTFPVRAGDISNSPPLLNLQPPAGIHYSRVPLAILEWKAAAGPATVEDCRHIFQPLTRLATCCTYTVGKDGHGKFDTIQEAVNALPAGGGEVCVLPGAYVENVTIPKGRRHITIKGCGPRSRVVSVAPAQGSNAAPVFHIVEAQDIKLQSLAIEAHDTGIGVHIDGRPLEVLVIEDDDEDVLPNLDITLENLVVRAATRCAVECEFGYNVTIRRCRVEMKDVPSARPAVYLTGEDALIEENVIVVMDVDRRVGEFEIFNPLDAAFAQPAHAAHGGLQLGGRSERIRVINNVIARGSGQGITLGNILIVNIQTGKPLDTQPDPVPDPCEPCDDGDTSVPPTGGGDTTRSSSQGDLYEILIERNRIFNMGLDGIGVAGFFDLEGADEFISVHRLEIIGNDIRKCLGRELLVPEAMKELMGYGGVSLADVDYLVIRDNFIVDNGPNFAEPVCGIFVLHGEGIEISRNHILNNGAKQLTAPPPPPPPVLAPAPPALVDAAGGQVPGASQGTGSTSGLTTLLLTAQAKTQSVKIGRRGGINIGYAIAPVELFAFADTLLPGQNGMPAAKIHDNIVSVPVGQALSLVALGPVSVVGNQFTSRGTILRFDSPSFFAATVLIMNLGFSFEFYSQLLTFLRVKSGQITINDNQTGPDSFLLKPRPGLDDLRFGEFVADGNVLFSNNQCVLDLAETGFSFAIFSILIFSLDDVGFLSNQCDASLVDDFIISQAFLFGVSLRASDNRFKEGLFNAVLSAITLGLYNTTTDNQSTHCLLVRGLLPQLTVDTHNTSLANLFGRGMCDRLGQRGKDPAGNDPNVGGSAFRQGP